MALTDIIKNDEIFGYLVNEQGIKFNPIEFDTMSILFICLGVFISVLLAMLIMYFLKKSAAKTVNG